MQRTVLLSKFCSPVCLSNACIVTKRNNLLSVYRHHTKGSFLVFFTPIAVAGDSRLPSDIGILVFKFSYSVQNNARVPHRSPNFVVLNLGIYAKRVR